MITAEALTVADAMLIELAAVGEIALADMRRPLLHSGQRIAVARKLEDDGLISLSRKQFGSGWSKRTVHVAKITKKGERRAAELSMKKEAV